MKKFILLTLISCFTLLGFSQNSGITYQAVIYNPEGEALPGYDNQLAPMVEIDVCLRFSIYGDGLEYEEVAQTTTDKFGMVNIRIGDNSQTGGSVNSINDVNWDTGSKSMRVELSTGGSCSAFQQISYQEFSYVPFAYYAQNDVNTAAIDALQDDVDQNGTALQDAIDAVQADVDQNETDSDAGDAALQADVDQNEADADAAIAALEASAVSELNDLSDALVESTSIYLGGSPSSTSSATNNTAAGTGALENVTTADNSVAVGYDALENITSGTQNTAFGSEAGESLTTGNENVAVGYRALYDGTTAEENVAVGRDALANATTALRNVAVGQDAGDSVTTGGYNVLVGYDAGEEITTGLRNVVVGASAGNDDLTTGNNNTVLGYGAEVSSASASNQTAIGYNAEGQANNSVTLGNASVTAVYMAQDSGATVYAGGFVGDVTGALTGNVTGNVTGDVTGDLTGNASTASALSTAIGMDDLSDVSSNDDNLVFGGAYSAQYLDSYWYANTTIIGYNAGIGGYYNNQMVLGNSSVSRIYASSDWGASMYASTYYTGSDRRFKNNIINIDSQLEKLSKINSKKYTNLQTGKTEFGVIAQDVQQIFPELVEELDYITDDKLELNSNGEKRLAVNYQGFVPILINAINEQQEMIKELQNKVDEIDELKQAIETLKQMILNQ